MPHRAKASFIDPMLLLRQDALPDDATRWLYQLKLDGYRAIAFKSGGVLHLRSRNNRDFSRTYPAVFQALAKLPNETVIDGEIVAVDAEGRPAFQLLQNAAVGAVPILYYVFDVMVLAGRNVMAEPLETRRDLLECKVLPTLVEPIRYVDALDAELPVLIQSVKEQRFEGLVAKRRDSRYEPGLRSGAWQKMRINQGQEFVIGGYTVGSRTFDALIFGYYEGDRLIYAARTRNGFTPAVRQKLFEKLRPLEFAACPFANLPETKSGRWGEGLTAAKMTACRWVQPVLVGQFEFLEWTGEHHLRHTRFVGLRQDKPAKTVTRESSPGTR
jgi:bifunctional non-homologous end joining protein LigD